MTTRWVVALVYKLDTCIPGTSIRIDFCPWFVFNLAQLVRLTDFNESKDKNKNKNKTKQKNKNKKQNKTKQNEQQEHNKTTFVASIHVTMTPTYHTPQLLMLLLSVLLLLLP